MAAPEAGPHKGLQHLPFLLLAVASKGEGGRREKAS